MVKNNKAFTLVELLAVIVILAIILVIAVPSIISTITESRKGALASSAKLIAGTAESMKISNQALGIEKDITCQDVSSYTEEDYTCDLEFVDGKAKVTLVGKGKFEGMSVCTGTKEDAEVTEGTCGGTGGSTGGSVTTVSFANDSWETIKAAVTAGNTSKYNVGDTKTVDLGSLGTHTVRIANKSACPTGSSALASETACGFVIEFADTITYHNMNHTNTNVGGWKDSAMRTYVNGTIYDALVAAIEDTDGTMIRDTTVVSGHGSTSGEKDFTTTDKVYLLSSSEVWGKDGIDYDTANGDTITRQLDYYATFVNSDGTQGVTTLKYAGAIKKNSSNSESWWLRSANSSRSGSFYIVSSNGSHTTDDCDMLYGVSPAFRLG